MYVLLLLDLIKTLIFILLMIHRNLDHTRQYIEAFQNGEEKGFNFFFRLHYKALCLYSFRITGNQEVAEEMVQDAFIRLWERHENFNHPIVLKSFLYTVCRNGSLNWLRSQKRETLNIKQLAYISSEIEPDMQHNMIAAETYAEIYRAINMLPPQCKKIFRMLFFEGKNFRQVAKELNLSVSTVRNQKARALMLLKQKVPLNLLILFILIASSD